MAKKIFAVWLMLFILFSGCKAEVLPEEPINEDIPKEEQNAENPPLDEQNPEEKFITEKIIGLDGTEKFIIRDFEGNQIGYEYSLIEPAQEWDLDIYSYRGKVTEGTMLIIEYDENGEPSLAKVPAERYYLLDENGYPVADTAFEVYECQSNNYSSDIYSWIAGVSEGIRYAYEIIDGEAILVEKAEPHKTECECGFIHTSYCFDWYGGYFKHGLNIGDEVFLEPVYSGIYVPFNNTERVVIYYGSY
ncbi:MAG: hypothetical protein IKU42_08540, partial [Oscillospiraceae bacterium]|nr:hypothetical protein [Oscillospiraceae bacterium]